jgi:hypothetical protein
MALQSLKKLFSRKPEAQSQADLFESFSTPDSLQSLILSEIHTLGVSENSATQLSYDKTQGLLAVGLKSGSLQV